MATKAKKIDRAFTETVINEVRNDHALWNSSSAEYSKTPEARKLDSWQLIVDELGKNGITKTATEVIEKWKYLKSEYRRHFRNENPPSGSGAKKKITWPWYASLCFIRDLVENRPTTTNVDEEVPPVNVDAELDGQLADSINGHSSTEMDVTTGKPWQKPSSPSATGTQSNFAKRKRRFDGVDSLDSAITAVLGSMGNSTEQSKSTPSTHFGNYVAATMDGPVFNTESGSGLKIKSWLCCFE